MKKCKYSYLIVPIGENGEEAYRAIIPRFNNILVMADTIKELNEAVIEMIDEDIKGRKKSGKPIPPEDNSSKFKGKVMLRIPPELHEQLYFEAQAHKTSLNKYIESKLAQ